MSASRLNAWLQLLRVSNAPTVVSNSLTGIAAALPAAATFPWRIFALTAPALVLIYVAGMATNDALDAAVDKVERPSRPVPSGRISRVAAFAFAVVATVGAIALLAAANWRAAIAGSLLALCALAYNLTHQKHPAAMLLMATCRALAIVTAACAAAWPLDTGILLGVSAVLWCYVLSISVLARQESADPRRIRVVIAMVCAISLLDATFLCVFERWPQALLAVGCFFLAATAQRRILGS